jgi:hypothetical protein
MNLPALMALAKEGKAGVKMLTRYGINDVVIFVHDKTSSIPSYGGSIDEVAEAVELSGEVLNDIFCYYRWHQIPRFNATKTGYRKGKDGVYPYKQEATIKRLAMQLVTDLLCVQVEWERDGATERERLGTFTPRKRRPDMMRVMRLTKLGKAAYKRHKKAQEARS